MVVKRDSGEVVNERQSRRRKLKVERPRFKEQKRRGKS